MGWLNQLLGVLLMQTSDGKSRIADVFPDVELTDQFGDRLRFRRDFVDSGRALIVNSMYTTCRGSCPGTSATIEGLRKTLWPIFGDQLVFLSFTLEPTVDTRDVLKSYAKIYGADQPQSKMCDWHFVRTSLQNVEALRRPLGFFDLDPRVDRDVTQHASLLLVGNPEKDRWCTLPAELRESTLVEAIRRIAGKTFQQRYGIKG